jgi:hypothetical protein
MERKVGQGSSEAKIKPGQALYQIQSSFCLDDGGRLKWGLSSSTISLLKQIEASGHDLLVVRISSRFRGRL